MMLYRLLANIDRTRFEPYVISLLDKGKLSNHIEALDIAVYSLGMGRGLPTPLALKRLQGIVRSLQPHLLQGWMYHGNLVASLADQMASNRPPVLWNIRHSLYDLKAEKWLTGVLIRLGGWLSQRPARIIYNSQLSAKQHEAQGYACQRREVIPNGFDCNQFKPLAYAHIHLKQELGLPADTLLIGLVARYHPMKDHANFIRAAGRLAQQYSKVYFVLVGRNVTSDNQALQLEIQSAGLKERLHLLGERTDIPAITAGLDIAASASWSEAFPNVIGEAMACGVPCVVTDVGDSAWIVGETGRVVPPRDATALAAAWAELIELGPAGRTSLGDAARQRVLNHFSLPKIVQQYEMLYHTVLSETRS